ncbi:MAG: hypothetical protein C0444_00425 [Microbacterium sp.]|nr:hypothetical protein [Microbacterium sp.]MBA4346851.1 hypothetical protein [Microbacterium sp.]
MIIFIYGTTAEAIKLAPIARRLMERGVPFEQWLTCQHTESLTRMIPELGLPEPDRIIAYGNGSAPLGSSRDVVRWLWTIWRWVRAERRGLRASLPAHSIIVVHGDTLTTVVGTWIARRLGLPSAHVEAGLRSGNWRHPFPEELDRRIAGRLATIHYTPSEEATANLAGKENVVYTHGNTVIDAVLDHAVDAPSERDPVGVVLLHRYEYLSNRELVEETMRVLAAESPLPLRFFVDAYARETIPGLLAAADGGMIQVQDKLPHEQFISLLRRASFIVTDSGGIQAEAALVGVPTLVHRVTTEQQEGVGENIVLSGWSSSALTDFLKSFEQYRRPAMRPPHSPSEIIVDDLARRGYAEPKPPVVGDPTADD